MTPRMTHVPRGPALAAAAIAALLLAGCSSGHVGDSWQCPLAEGGACDSVVAADPAVPDMGAARNRLLAEPLWRQRADDPGKPVAAPCGAECGGGFDPFGWLMRLFRAEAGEAEAGETETGRTDGAAQRSEPAAGETVAAASAARNGERRPEEPEAVALPAEPASAEDDPGGDGLRTGEIVARIWIAPFVDADGVYREASHVRVVLEPAGWRLSR